MTDELNDTRPDGSELFSGLSRRQLIKRGVVVGGAAVWIPPVIQSLRLPAFGQTGSAPPELQDCGWMTGGGTARSTGGVRVHYGFELHCQISEFPPNRLEVNWRAGGVLHAFHLDSLDSTLCTDALGGENPPDANFDTLVGAGPGSLRIGTVAQSGRASFSLRDAGEPGAGARGQDYIDLVVRNASNAVVLEVHGYPDGGTLQAHTAYGRRRC